MKKISPLFTIAFLVLMTSCTESDKDFGNVGIIGIWKLSTLESTNPYDINGDGRASTDLLTEYDIIEDGILIYDCFDNDCFDDDYCSDNNCNYELIIFNDDNTGTIISNSTVEVSADLEIGTTDTYIWTSTCFGETSSSPFTWTLIDNTVTIIEGLESTTYTLDGNKLSFLLTDGFEILSGTTSDVVILEDLTIKYTKQCN